MTVGCTGTEPGTMMTSKMADIFPAEWIESDVVIGSDCGGGVMERLLPEAVNSPLSADGLKIKDESPGCGYEPGAFFPPDSLFFDDFLMKHETAGMHTEVDNNPSPNSWDTQLEMNQTICVDDVFKCSEVIDGGPTLAQLNNQEESLSEFPTTAQQFSSSNTFPPTSASTFPSTSASTFPSTSASTFPSTSTLPSFPPALSTPSTSSASSLQLRLSSSSSSLPPKFVSSFPQAQTLSPLTSSTTLLANMIMKEEPNIATAPPPTNHRCLVQVRPQPVAIAAAPPTISTGSGIICGIMSQSFPTVATPIVAGQITPVQFLHISEIPAMKMEHTELDVMPDSKPRVSQGFLHQHARSFLPKKDITVVPERDAALVEKKVHGPAAARKCSTLEALLSQKPLQPGESLTADIKLESKVEQKEDNIDKKWEEVKSFLKDDEMKKSHNKRIRLDSEGQDSVVTCGTDKTDFDGSEYDEDTESCPSDDESQDGKPSEVAAAVVTAITGKKRRRQASSSSSGGAAGCQRYFWQYNLQSKGPKCSSIAAPGGKLQLIQDMRLTSTDPHHLPRYQDPVFHPRLNIVAGVRHGGKARRGDGNNLTPNPRKLFSIGSELKRLTCDISDMTPVSELPSTVRVQSRREKNKLASRACRLKKKAQHEANKVKLWGLDREHAGLVETINSMKLVIKQRMQQQSICPSAAMAEQQPSLPELLSKLIQENLGEMVAGHTTEYVNAVIHRVANGDPRGGLHLTSKKLSPAAARPQLQTSN